ncbi:hypothetical protein EE612_033547 [Oryza sativa]|nr:hypothetical protein EE612_033547 [Oryza sativa]
MHLYELMKLPFTSVSNGLREAVPWRGFFYFLARSGCYVYAQFGKNLIARKRKVPNGTDHIRTLFFLFIYAAYVCT